MIPTDPTALASLPGRDPESGAPRFDAAPPPDGYVWWYVDALSDDGRRGLTLILFIGSVFSPYYAWARARGPADPRRHVAVNLALYGRPGARWCMSERGAGALETTPEALRIGPSRAQWDGTALGVDIDEWAVPLLRPMKGRIRIEPNWLNAETVALDAPGRHRWGPIAPSARIEVRFERPGLAWSGHAYMDWNFGTEPLERAFRRWDWSRARTADGRVAVFYDITRRGGDQADFALAYAPDETVETIAAPARRALPRGLWGVKRLARHDGQGGPRIARSFEDAPFYTRALLDTALAGRPIQAVHESLDLDRFERNWVKLMLPFRMPRLAWGGAGQ